MPHRNDDDSSAVHHAHRGDESPVRSRSIGEDTPVKMSIGRLVTLIVTSVSLTLAIATWLANDRGFKQDQRRLWISMDRRIARIEVKVGLDPQPFFDADGQPLGMNP